MNSRSTVPAVDSISETPLEIEGEACRANGPVREAFDQRAGCYDAEFSDSRIGRLQRRAVWRQIDRLFGPGDRILDLGCGTGVDAIHLAERGLRVHAVDVSPRMIAQLRRKVSAGGFESLVTAEVAGVEQWLRSFPWHAQSCLWTELEDATATGTAAESPGAGLEADSRFAGLQAGLPPLPEQAGLPVLPTRFDGVLSNFGALNCVAELRPLALALSHLVRRGGWLAFCLISRFCLWETAFYSLQAQFSKAWRRSRGRSMAFSGSGSEFPVYYPTVDKVRAAFEPEFRLRRFHGIGIFVPPSYLEPLARRVPAVLTAAGALDRAISAWPLCRGLADHTLFVLERRGRP